MNSYLYKDIVHKHPDNYIQANPMSTPLSINNKISFNLYSRQNIVI